MKPITMLDYDLSFIEHLLSAKHCPTHGLHSISSISGTTLWKLCKFPNSHPTLSPRKTTLSLIFTVTNKAMNMY